MFHKKAKKTTQPVVSSGDDKKASLRLRGMKNILSDELKYWDFISHKAMNLASSYRFNRIDTPILEKQNLDKKFFNLLGDSRSWEIYSFADKDGENISLRSDSIISMAAAYIDHNMGQHYSPTKLFWIGNLFRYVKPQSGIARQFGQFAYEIIGEAKPIADAQIIFMTNVFFKELQIDTEVQINSVGCNTCRVEYANALKDFFKNSQRKKQLCEKCKKNALSNPLSILECKEKECVEVCLEAPFIIDSLDENCRVHFVKVLETLDELGVSYNLNSSLIQGPAYGTRTIFEVWTKNEDSLNEQDGAGSKQVALAGGGRHDDLISYMGGGFVPAVGVKLGIERIISKIKEKNISLKQDKNIDIFLAQVGDQARRRAILLFEELRKAGFKIGEKFTTDSLRQQVEEATKLGARVMLILGQKEIAENTVLTRDMESGIQEIVDQKKIVQYLKKKII